MIKKLNKPAHFKNSQPINNGRQDIDADSMSVENPSYAMDYKEMHPSSSVYEEDKYEDEEYHDREESMQRCKICLKYITPNDEDRENLLILECAHFTHKDCMKKRARKEYLDSQQVKCAE